MKRGHHLGLGMEDGKVHSFLPGGGLEEAETLETLPEAQ